MIRRALISVSNKAHLEKLIPHLETNKFQIFSTGGTFSKISKLVQNKSTVQDISFYINFPEICDGRVKTLHPKIFAGILGRSENSQHIAELNSIDAHFFDMVVVNLYPFEDTLNAGETDERALLDQIDIGGYSLIRSAIKNYDLVTVLTDPNHYEQYISMKTSDNPDNDHTINKHFAKEAANQLMKNSIEINNWMNNDGNNIGVSYQKQSTLKYGMNPSQQPSSIYLKNGQKPLYNTINGTPSYINLLDANNAIQLVHEVKNTLGFDCCASFKHNSPAGVAISTINVAEHAYNNAIQVDPLSSYGDFLGFSGTVSLEMAELLKKKLVMELSKKGLLIYSGQKKKEVMLYYNKMT